MKIGYIRVSTTEQNTIRQEVLLKELGVDEIFIEKASGKNTERLELKRLITYVRQGDTVIVESISRFARNTRDLLELIGQLTAKNVEFVSKKEAIDTTTPTGKFMLTIFGAVANWNENTFYSGNKRVSLLPRSKVNIKEENRLSTPILTVLFPSGNQAKYQRWRLCGG